MKTEEHTNVNVKNIVEEIELRQEESVVAKRLKKVEQQFNGQCLGQEDATYNDEQISSNSITGESSDNIVNERHSRVQGMIQKFESLRKENVAVKGLEKIEQQLNGQHLEQKDATYNDEQTSLSPITNENNTDEVNDMLEKRKAIEDREAKAQQLQKAEQRLANNQKRIEQKYLHDRHPEQYTPHNGEQASLNLTTDEVSSNDSEIYVPTEEANEELAKYLEEYVRDVNEQDGDGRTLLHFAVEINHEELVKFLIKHRANVDAQDKDEQTPLHLAAAYNCPKITKYLVESKANINAQDRAKHTPLYYAVANDNKKLAKFLINHGADRSLIKDEDLIDRLNSMCSQLSEVASSHFKTNNVTEVGEKTRKFRAKSKKSRSQLKDKEDRICSLEKTNEELRARLEQVGGKLEKIQGELAESKDFLTENETRQETLNELYEENQSLRQRIQDLENKNTTLNSELEKNKNQHSKYVAENETKSEAFNKRDEENKLLKQEINNLKSENAKLKSELEKNKNQHSQTSEVSLKKVEKKPPLSKVAYVSLVATSVVGSILSIVSGSFVLSMIATSVTSALVASGITYKMSKPTTELKEVNIQSPDNNKACEI